MDLEDLRAELSLLVHGSHEPSSALDNALRRNHGLRSLLFLRRDQARSAIQDTCSAITKQVAELQQELLADINTITKQKVAMVYKKKDQLTQLRADLQLEIAAVHELLQVGNERWLEEVGVSRLNQLQEILDQCTNADAGCDGLYLEFRPNSLLEQLHSRDSIGHIQCTAVAQDSLSIPCLRPSCSFVAALGFEERLPLSAAAGDLTPDVLQYLTVTLKDPMGQMVPVLLDADPHGTHGIKFTLSVEGEHTLDICMYGAHLKGSPYIIGCVGKSSSEVSDSADNREKHTKEKAPQICRKVLSDVNKILVNARSIDRLRNPGETVIEETEGSRVKTLTVRLDGDSRLAYMSREANRRPDEGQDRHPKKVTGVGSDPFDESLVVHLKGGKRATAIKPGLDIRELINEVNQFETTKSMMGLSETSTKLSADGGNKRTEENKRVRMDFIGEEKRGADLLDEYRSRESRRFGMGRGKLRSLRRTLVKKSGWTLNVKALNPVGWGKDQLGEKHNNNPGGPKDASNRQTENDVSVKNGVADVSHKGVPSASTSLSAAPGLNEQGRQKGTSGGKDLSHSCTQRYGAPAQKANQEKLTAQQYAPPAPAAQQYAPPAPAAQQYAPPAPATQGTSTESNYAPPAPAPTAHAVDKSSTLMYAPPAPTVKSVEKSNSLKYAPALPVQNNSASCHSEKVCTDEDSNNVEKDQFTFSKPIEVGAIPVSERNGAKPQYVMPKASEVHAVQPNRGLQPATRVSRWDLTPKTATRMGFNRPGTQACQSSENRSLTTAADSAGNINKNSGRSSASAVSNNTNMPQKDHTSRKNLMANTMPGLGSSQRTHNGSMGNGSVRGNINAPVDQSSSETGPSVRTQPWSKQQDGDESNCKSDDKAASDDSKGTEESNHGDTDAASYTTTTVVKSEPLTPVVKSEPQTPASTTDPSIVKSEPRSAGTDMDWDESNDVFSSVKSESATAIKSEPQTPSTGNGAAPNSSTPLTSSNPAHRPSRKLFEPSSDNRREIERSPTGDNKENQQPSKRSERNSSSSSSSSHGGGRSQSGDSMHCHGDSYGGGRSQSGDSSRRHGDSSKGSGSGPVGRTSLSRPTFISTGQQGCWGEGQLKVLSRQDINIKFLGRITGLHYPIGVTACKNYIVVCDQGNDAVKIFNWDGKLESRLAGDPPFFRPSAVVIVENEIYIKDSHQIQVYSSSGRFIRRFGKQNFRRPYGLSQLDTKELIVLDTGTYSILRLSTDGKKCIRSPYKVVDGKERSSKCRFLATYKDKLVVTDLGLNETYITDLEGKHKKTICGFGNKEGEFFEPSGVTFDSAGHLFIADSKNNRIQVFSEDGKFHCVLPLPCNIVRPSDIHLTPDGCLLVSNLLNHAISVFQIV